MVKLTFSGGAQSVTGALHLIEGAGFKVLVDCGLFQGSRICDERNYEPLPFNPKEIAAVFITHAHMDHTGRLPKLYRDGYRGPIYATPPTRDFAELLLQDSESILSREAIAEGREPLWNYDDLWGVMRLFKPLAYHEIVSLSPGFSVTPFDAGHILGSTFYLFSVGGKQIVFSGDLGNPPVLMLNPTDVFPPTAEFAVVESSYGNRVHEPGPERKKLLQDIIADTISKKGTLMIPAFALERTQELLLDLHLLAEQKKIPSIPIFLDSPLAIKATEIYQKHISWMSEDARQMIEKGQHIFQLPSLRLTLTKEESKEINDVPPPKIIIAGSGMSNGGRILHHERRYLQDPNSTLLIVGYQAKGSLGRRLLDGEKNVEIFGDSVTVRCRIAFIGGFSSHADQRQAIAWLRAGKELKKIFLVQGEDEAAEALAQVIRSQLDVEAVVPSPGQEFVLDDA